MDVVTVEPKLMTKILNWESFQTNSQKPFYTAIWSLVGGIDIIVDKQYTQHNR